MAPRDTVKIGNVQRMGGVNPMEPQVPAPQPPPSYESNTERIRKEREAAKTQNPDAWAYREAGLPAFLQGIPETVWGFQDFLDQNLNPGRWFSGQPQIGAQSPPLAKTKGGSPDKGPVQPSISRQDVIAEVMAMMGMDGGGAARPDFSAYRAALTDQAAGLNAQIQAMYNALGEEAGANVGRIQDIYGGAEQGIGNVYDSAAGNVADAFSSSQQQAADQLARLGIEAAAPAVINPAALAQAQAVSGLEQGRASGQAAAQRYGASAGGFGSQMAQVAQQQGTEMNAAILASLQNRLADSLAAEQTGGGGGGGGRGPSVSDRLRLLEYADEEFNRRAGIPTPAQEQWGYEQNFILNQATGELAKDFLPKNQDATPEQVQEALALARSILTQQLR